MPSLRVHCKISEDRTGDKYYKLHEWIDAPHKELGVNHRVKRHAFTKKEAYEIKKKFGDKAVPKWLFHIALDNLETAFKQANKTYREKNVYNFFKFGMVKGSRFIYWDFDRMDVENLESNFKNYEEDEESEFDDELV